LQKSLWQVEQQNKEHLLHAGYHLWGVCTIRARTWNAAVWRDLCNWPYSGMCGRT